MKKVIPLSFLILVSVLAFIYVIKNPMNDSPALKLHAQNPLTSDKAGIYEVHLKATQASQGKPDLVVAEVLGKLVQYEQSKGVTINRWLEVQKLSVNNREATADELKDLTSKITASKVIKGGTYEHYFAQDFPKNWFRLELNFLQRLLVPHKTVRNSIYQKREKEEMGQYLVEYTNLDRGDYRDVKKKFISYENPLIEMDRSQNTVHYVLTKQGRLVSADGDVAFEHDAVGGDKFTISLKADLIAVEPKPQVEPISLASLNLANDETIELVAAENRANNNVSFDEAMKYLPLITEQTDIKDVTLVFLGLKYELRARPERAAEVRNRILATEGRDVGARRQLAAAFGALAQSEQPAIANMLAEMASQCKDVFCKDQAIVALNDHAKPTPESAKKMIDLVNTQPDYDTTTAAILALGSIAHKIGKDVPDATDVLINAYNKPENAKLKRVVIAGMGNHGDNRYLASINDAAKNTDAVTRGSAYYSYRHLTGSDVDETLTAAIEQEKDSWAVNEGLKALTYRNLPSAQYDRIADRIASISNEEDAKEATRLFLKSYGRHPESLKNAMAILQERSTVPNVKSAIARRLEERTTF